MACVKTLLFFILLIIELSVINSVVGDKKISSRHLDADHEHDWKEFQDFQEWKKWKNNSKSKKDITGNNDEAVENFNKSRKLKNRWANKALSAARNDSIVMARYIVNQANWTAVSTVSTMNDTKPYTSANVVSMSDGHLGNGSGIPYVLLTHVDDTAQDLSKDSRATMMMTLAEGPWCQDQSMDRIDPRCARVTLTGQIEQISTKDEDYEIAKSAVFGRHPSLTNMPPNHDYYFAKLKIESIVLLDGFGGPKYINVKQYLDASIEGFSIELYNFEQSKQLQSLGSAVNSNFNYKVSFTNCYFHININNLNNKK